MIRRPPRSTLSSSSAASDVYKRQGGQLTVLETLYLPDVKDLSHLGGQRWVVRGKIASRLTINRRDFPTVNTNFLDANHVTRTTGMPWSPQDGSLISRLCPVGGRTGPEATQKGKGSQCGGQYPNLQ